MAAPWTTLDLAGTRWTVHPDWQRYLLGQGGLLWQEWEATQRIATVKQAPHRTVHRVELAPGAVFVKHYPVRGWRAWFRQWLRPTKARLEYQRTLAVAAQTLPTIEPVALGERADRQSYFITREWSNAQTLDEFLRQRGTGLPRRDRVLLIDELATLLARLHRSGLKHHDLHAGNLLIRPAGSGWEMTLLDLYAIELGAPLERSASFRNLAVFGNWFWPRTSRTQRRRFIGVYLRERGWTTDPAWVRRLEAATWRRHLAVLKQRAGRCLRENREFTLARSGPWRGWFLKSWSDSDNSSPRASASLRLDSLLATSTIEPLKASRSSQVWRQGETIHKRFAVTKRTDLVTQPLLGSPARRSWYFGFLLREAGIPTPKPLALMEHRRCGLVGESRLVTEYVAQAQDLRTWLKHQPARAMLLPLVREAVAIVGRLHQYGFSHRDLKAANWLVAPDGRGQKLWLIDLVGVTQPRWLSRRRRAQNLARFALSLLNQPGLTRTDTLRCLRKYLGPNCSEWKPWWRSIEREMNVKRVRNRRTGRPIT